MTFFSRTITKAYNLLKSSTLTQFYITVAFVTVSCLLWIMNRSLPETLQNVLLVVIGFYFGRKTLTMDEKGE